MKTFVVSKKIMDKMPEETETFVSRNLFKHCLKRIIDLIKRRSR